MRVSSNYDQLRIEDTITSLDESRNLICEKIDQVEELIREIQQEYRKHSEHSLSFKDSICDYSASIDKDKLRKTIDWKFWDIVLDISQVEKFISSKEKSDMRYKMMDEPPIFSADDARKLISGIMNSTEALATNLIKKIYSELANASFYVGNKYNAKKQLKNKNKIEKSFRMSVFSSYGLPSYVMHNDEKVAILQDLERVCYLVDGKLQPEIQGNIVNKIEEGLRTGNLNIAGEYFNIIIFKNGNVKVDFKDKDIVDKINLWGSRGNQLPDFSNLFNKGV